MKFRREMRYSHTRRREPTHPARFATFDLPGPDPTAAAPYGLGAPRREVLDRVCAPKCASPAVPLPGVRSPPSSTFAPEGADIAACTPRCRRAGKRRFHICSLPCVVLNVRSHCLSAECATSTLRSNRPDSQPTRFPGSSACSSPCPVEPDSDPSHVTA